MLHHVLFALSNHLIRDFAKENGHSLAGAVVASNRQHHLCVVHQPLRVCVSVCVCVRSNTSGTWTHQ